MITSSTTNFMAPGRKVLSVLLVVLLVFCPLLQIRAAASSIEDILLVIWSAIRACGINLAGTATGTISFLYDEIKDFATSAGNTVTDVLYGLKYSVNSLGEFIINDTFVSFVSDFINYLTNKYSLTDNSSKQLNQSNTTLDNLTSYLLPLSFTGSDNWTADYIVFTASAPVYGILYRQAESGSMKHYYGIGLWAEEPATVQCRSIKPNGDVQATYYVDLLETADNGIYWSEFQSITLYDGAIDFTAYDVYPKTTVHTAFTSLADIEYGEDPVYAITNIIIAPEDSSSFTIGDGAQINIGVPWGSSIYDLFDHIRTLIGSLSNQITIYYHDLASIESQVPKPSDVENLPAGTIYNINGIYQNSEGEGGIRFGGIWHYVSDWIEDFTEAAPIIWFVVTNSPSQLVNLLYATVVLTIVIGFIHKARSH